MIYLEKPENFESEFDIVGILIQYKTSFLLLKRASHKPQGGTWGAPGGKVEKGESLEEAIIRETFEETSIVLSLNNLMYFKPFYVFHEGHNFTYHLYSYETQEKPEIILEKDGHDVSGWFTTESALQLNLIHDMAFCLENFTNNYD